MRVISQNERYDFPYETIIIVADFENIIARVGEKARLIGRYSTEEKAIKAMKMLREAWINETVEFEDGIYHRNIIFRFPQDDEIEV